MAEDKSDLLFLDDEVPASSSEDGDNDSIPWTVLIVDDDPEVHTVTRWVLRGLVYEKRPVRFLSAYSAEQAREFLSDNSDVGVIFLDVVMEDENAGLNLAHYIRREMKNQMVRIILRTGHPGQAPEQRVMLDYDINDYKEKTELTSLKLHTSVLAGLRSYRDLRIIDTNRRGLQKIIESLASIYEIRSLQNLASAILTQLAAILHLKPNSVYCHLSGFTASRDNHEIDDFSLIAASGDYEPFIGSKIWDRLPLRIQENIREALRLKHSLYFEDRFVAYFCSKNGGENILYMEGMEELNEWDRDLIEIFCINVSIAFDNIYLNKEIVDTQKEIIYTLGEIAEARSHETGQHVKRVAEYTWLLAIKYGLSEEEADILRLATPTHDIGKLGIPDLILNKPGKLTEEEFQVMKTHSSISYEMLRKSERRILQAGAILALQHHERWDGDGYPMGLKGEQIHIYGRIVALADVFDALGSNRVYKDAWPLDDIIAHIQSESGKHFDPELIRVFMDNLDEFLKIRDCFPDNPDPPAEQ